jgi:two-component system OmpR family sensor kinase
MGGVRELAARTPLRIKLVVTVLVLAAAGLTLSGFTATESLHSYLLNRVDSTLSHATGPISNIYGEPDTGPPAGGSNGTASRDDHGPPSQFYIAAFDSSGAVIQSVQPFEYASVPKLPNLTTVSTATLEGKPFTVPSKHGGAPWRVVVRPLVGGGFVAIATSLSDLDHTVNRLVLLEVLIGAGVLILIAGGGYLLIRRSLRPLVEVEHTAAAIAAGDLSQRVPELHPSTEVGRLSGALNGMLAQIETAFGKERESQQQARASEERMRRFVADASHELRTPLTSIRGFAELHRMGAAADPGEVQHMMRRIEDEAARMGLLVEDLLLLARLDQQRPLEQHPVDLLAIAGDTVHDAQRVDPERSIALEAHTGVPPVVTGDEARLRQVFGNLMGNALTHTPAGTPITVTVTSDADAGVATVAIADAGPGLSEEEAAHVFERFYRADPARNRNAGGTGLGLSIVAGLVAAHGGIVSVESAPGDGATFRVELPLAATAG